MNRTYELRGHQLRERQLFRRTYTFERKKRTAIYFIERGKVYYLSEDGSANPCSFGLQFLGCAPTVNIEPLDEFYTQKAIPVEEVSAAEESAPETAE